MDWRNFPLRSLIDSGRNWIWNWHQLLACRCCTLACRRTWCASAFSYNFFSFFFANNTRRKMKRKTPKHLLAASEWMKNFFFRLRLNQCAVNEVIFCHFGKKIEIPFVAFFPFACVCFYFDFLFCAAKQTKDSKNEMKMFVRNWNQFGMSVRRSNNNAFMVARAHKHSRCGQQHQNQNQRKTKQTIEIVFISVSNSFDCFISLGFRSIEIDETSTRISLRNNDKKKIQKFCIFRFSKIVDERERKSAVTRTFRFLFFFFLTTFRWNFMFKHLFFLKIFNWKSSEKFHMNS